MKKLMLLIIALMIAGLALAQTDITIGTGTSTGRYPFNDYFVYSRSQCIYLESEIGAPGTIHKLRWYRNDTGANANAIGTTQIWLKTVSNNVMTDVNWEDPGTLVAEISNIDLGAGGAWYEIDITDFVYNGGNLLVSVYTQNAAYTTPHAYWRYTTTTGNLCRLGNSDSVNPPTLSLSTSRPNIQINMTTGAPSVAPNPAILSAPANGGYALIGDLLRWNSGGGFPATYDVYLDTVDGSTLVSDNQTGLTYTPTLAPGTTYYWKVVASNAFGDAAPSPTWSFMTPGATQLVESFENTTFPPAGWANGTTGNWTRSTSYYKHGVASAYKYGSTSTAYVLSTPKLTITGTSTLNLWTLASGITGTLQVVYSPDRVTWTALGTPITHAATNTWYNTVADLSSLAGNNYYLGIQTGLQAVSYYVDLVIGPEITPEAPGAPTLSAPADLATNVNEYTNFTWTAPVTGGVPTGYKLYVDTVNPPVAQVADLNALTYTLTTALAYNTTYYWSVAAYNGAGTGPQAAARSFTTRANPTISTFPWEVNFGTVSGDWPVLNWSQMAGFYGSALSTGTQWFQDDFANVATPLNKSAKINIYGTTRNGWLVTPPIAIPAAGYELKFDIALTDWNGTVAPVAGEQADDKFIVFIDDNPNMSSPTILREWNNTGSPYVYDNVSNIGENHIINLDAYTGTVYFAFYGESTITGGDNDFFIDNVTVRETPAAPIFSYSPESINFGSVMQGVPTALQAITITNIGGGELSVNAGDISITGPNADAFTLNTSNLPALLIGGQSTGIYVSLNANVEGPIAATITIVNDGNSYEVALTANALPIFTITPLTMDFGSLQAMQTSAWQNVTITNNGATDLNILATDVSLIGANADQFAFDAVNLPAVLATSQSVTIPVRFAPTTQGSKTATLRVVNNEVRTNYDVALSGNALSATALYEGFEGATFPPADWTTSTTAWQSYTSYYHTGTKAAKSGYSTGDWWMMTPRLSITEDANDLYFWYRDYSESTSWDYADEYTYVMVSTTGNAPADFTDTVWTGDYLNFTTTWQLANIDLSAYNGQNIYVAFKSTHTGGNYRIIDDVSGPERYVPAGPPEPVVLSYPANEATELPIAGFDLTWTPGAGGVPTYYAVYMSQDEATIYDDLYWETTNTSFNPVTEGGVTFDYLDRWYWTVQAFNADGDAIVDPARWFQIEDAPQVITTFPWVENFDLATTPPADWTVADVDGAGTNWVGSPTYSHSAPNSYKHAYSTTPATGQDGWLITPAVQVPVGNYYLSWWNYNVYPTYMVYNGVKVNTTNNPADPNWVEIWTNAAPASAWSNAVVNLSSYAGQTVYFAFNYQGYDADDWYIDDVSIYELLVDEIPPTISHLPVLNTPLENELIDVVADIVDDVTWNNAIGGANLYYSIDGGSTWSTPIAMTLDIAPTYHAAIPPQALGTTVQYYIQAWDSLNNTATSTTFSFGVNDPTWIWYDQGGTTYLGYNTTDFGPTVLFENPFYGSGNALQLLAVDGSSYYGNAANLQIFTFDGSTMTPYFTTPIPVTFGAQTYETFDLSTYNVQINTPYFLVSYLDIPMGNYILFDGTYDYGTTYVFQGTTLYTPSNPGSWAIGAYVTTGMGLALDAPVVSMMLNGIGEPTLVWDIVTGANSYMIYGSADPYAADPWTLLTTTTGNNYTYSGTEGMKFFKVVANSEAPIVRGTQLTTRSIGNAVKAPKVIINNIRN